MSADFFTLLLQLHFNPPVAVAVTFRIFISPVAVAVALGRKSKPKKYIDLQNKPIDIPVSYTHLTLPTIYSV